MAVVSGKCRHQAYITSNLIWRPERDAVVRDNEYDRYDPKVFVSADEIIRREERYDTAVSALYTWREGRRGER